VSVGKTGTTSSDGNLTPRERREGFLRQQHKDSIGAGSRGDQQPGSSGPGNSDNSCLDPQYRARIHSVRPTNRKP
jgi:hypothetical protein